MRLCYLGNTYRGVMVSAVHYWMTEDASEALMLSQLLYWFDPSHDRVTITRDGRRWLAKRLDEWEAECFVAPRKAKDILARFEKRGWIVREYHLFKGMRTTFISINEDALEADMTAAIERYAGQVPAATTAVSVGRKSSHRSDENRPTGRTKNVRPITESTTESTTENITNKGDAREIPTVEQCIEYAETIGLSELEARRFHTYFDSVGWVRGSNKVPIRRWRQALQNWKLNSVKYSHNTRDKPDDSPGSLDRQLEYEHQILLIQTGRANAI